MAVAGRYSCNDVQFNAMNNSSTRADLVRKFNKSIAALNNDCPDDANRTKSVIDNFKFAFDELTYKEIGDAIKDNPLNFGSNVSSSERKELLKYVFDKMRSWITAKHLTSVVQTSSVLGGLRNIAASSDESKNLYNILVLSTIAKYNKIKTDRNIPLDGFDPITYSLNNLIFRGEQETTADGSGSSTSSLSTCSELAVKNTGLEALLTQANATIGREVTDKNNIANQLRSCEASQSQIPISTTTEDAFLLLKAVMKMKVVGSKINEVLRAELPNPTERAERTNALYERLKATKSRDVQ